MSVQTSWRSCPKCQGMHFAGLPFKGVCPAGGQHAQTGSFAYAMLHEFPPTEHVQSDFRSCRKCQGLFFGPFKGKCPAGGEHDPEGSFNYAMRVQTFSDTIPFDSGPLNVEGSLTLSGDAHLIFKNNGDFTFSCNAHDSGFDNIDYVVSVVIVTLSGLALTFQHSGNVEGTTAGLPFGTPKRDDHFITGGNDVRVKNEFDDLSGAKIVASIDGRDTLVKGLEGALTDLLKKALDTLEQAAAKAVVALVV